MTRFALLIPFVLLAAPVSADLIKLKNGETIEGVVTSKTDQYIVIKIAGGEMGFSTALLDSVDSNAGPKAEDLTKREEDARRRNEVVQAERETARLQRASAAAAVEAAARRESASTADASAAPATVAERTAAYEDEVVERLNAIDEVLNQVPTRR